MIIANTEAVSIEQSSKPLPLKMAAQSICPANDPQLDVWVEFLVRGHGMLSHLSPFELVERAYGRRGLLFDQDIIDACLSRVDRLNSKTWISINIHPGSLSRKSFGDFVKQKLEQYGVDPARLVLEVVEFDGPVNLMASRSTIEDLRAYGIRFALDDFGPGFSNLDLVASQLVDFVKIDRNLIRFVDVDNGHVRLVKGLQALAQQTGVELVAEGVESLEQAEILKAMDIAWLQGFAFSNPKLVQ